MKLRWPWVARWRYDAAVEAVRVFQHCHTEVTNLLPSRRLVDPVWRDSEMHMRKLSDWLYNYEGIKSNGAQDTFDKFTRRYLEIRKLATQDANYRARIGLSPLEPWR